MIGRPMYCEQCGLYPRKRSGADCYYDYLDALEREEQKRAEMRKTPRVLKHTARKGEQA